MCISVANNRLFVGSIPKSKTKEQIVEEFSKVTGKGLCLQLWLGLLLTANGLCSFFQRASVTSSSTSNLRTRARTEASASWSTKTTKRPRRLAAGS